MISELPTHIWVQSVIRRLGQDAIGVYVIQKGDPDRGVVLLKLSMFGNICRLLIQQRNIDGVLEWMNATKAETPDIIEADDYISRAVSRDPDLWVIEVETRDGENPFEIE